MNSTRGWSSSAPFTGLLLKNGIAISMDGRGSWRDNVFVGRLWRSVKYEEVYLRAYERFEAQRLIGRYLDFSTASGRVRALTRERRTWQI